MIWLLLAGVGLSVLIARSRTPAITSAARRTAQATDRVLRLFGVFVLMVGAALISLTRFLLRLDRPRW